MLEKGSDLTLKINERLKAYREDGTLDRLKQKWTDPDDSKKTMADTPKDGPNGTIVVATSIDNDPINYLKDDRMHGMCIELLEMIARDLGYGIEYRTTNAGSLIAEVQSGKADIAENSFSITDERKKMVDMTEPYYEGGVAVIVRTDGSSQAEQGFFEDLAACFERTFITENRWQLILDGLGVTMLISIVSGAAGLSLGFLFVLARRKKEGGIADKLIHLIESLGGGLPVVVVLMLFYYVIFGFIDAPGAYVPQRNATIQSPPLRTQGTAILLRQRVPTQTWKQSLFVRRHLQPVDWRPFAWRAWQSSRPDRVTW